VISHQYRAVIVLVSLALVILLPLVLLLLSSPYSQYCKGQGDESILLLYYTNNCIIIITI